MKNFFTILVFTLQICIGCSNGLDKTINQELTDGEIQRAMRKYNLLPLERDYILDFRNWICSNELLRMRYDTLRYKTIIDYFTCCSNITEECKESYIKEYPMAESYKKQADSILNLLITHQPDSLVSLSFVNKTIRKTVLDDIPIFHIKVTPLKGIVEQFDFEYYFSSKIRGERTIDDIDHILVKRGHQTSPVSKETIVGYIGELWTDINANDSTEELLRDYNFIYKITNIRYNGRNWGDLPFRVRYYIAGEPTFKREYAIEEIIPYFIDSSYKSFEDYVFDTVKTIQLEKHPTVHNLFLMYENDSNATVL